MAVVTARRTVTVQPGDTLWSLAERFYGNGLDWRKIYAANPKLKPNPNIIVPPQQLVIPPLVTPPKVHPGVDIALVGSIASVLAATIAPTLAYSSIAGLLGMRTRIQRIALQAILNIVERYPLPKIEGIGAAQREIVRMNEMRRAAFLQLSTGRLLDSINSGLAQGLPESEVIPQAVNAENRYYAQHYAAAAQRMSAANAIDALQGQYGDVLGWYAASDRRTTAECKNANGKNFSALTQPKIGWPGIVHTNCRCSPGKPHREGVMLP